MDKSDEQIIFDSLGNCNHCNQAQKELDACKAEKGNLLARLVQIRNDGKNKKYNCLIGLSGGVDSSTVLHYAVKWGLRPLCFSIDNGYNDPKSDENIMRLVEGLQVPFYRYTIDLKKFKKLQSAFIRAGLVNIEIPTDHILMAASLEMASKYGIKWILSGGNVATESIMPASWSYNARDLTHIKDVYFRMTSERLRGLPLCSIWKWNYYRWVKKIKFFYLLDYIYYDRQKSIEQLNKDYKWQSYGEKHGESLFTKWFQNFYLFTKFGYDKRKAHLSSLIMSGQMTRDEALEELGKDLLYPKFGIEEKVLAYPKNRHESFKQDKWYNRISKLVKFINKYVTLR